jgi:RNA polymerase sigma-70 factor (ECF subfamily)
MSERPVTSKNTTADSFTVFARDAEPRLRHALCAAFGPDRGREATADALAFGWEHWDRLQAMDNPIGYLWGVGRNKARRVRRHRLVLPDIPGDEAPRIEPKLPAALARLSERQRVVVMLVCGLGWSYAEAADVLGVSKSTVQTQVDRGLEKLRRALGVEA